VGTGVLHALRAGLAQSSTVSVSRRRASRRGFPRRAWEPGCGSEV